ncbi:MAG: YgiQ family radical SAM protein [bacterium]
MFLPISKSDMIKRGWDECDIILITGDAYVDHHSYGASVIGRVLESASFKVGIISQPDWRTTDDFKKLGCPKLFFGITSGNVDSMVANYTAKKRPRQTDLYSPLNKSGLRPDRATIVYSNRIKEAFKGIPIVLGGVESSMRRLAHYDYWNNAVRRSIILDAKADILVYGMGEKQIVEIAKRISNGEKIQEINNIRGTVIVRNNYDYLDNCIEIPSYEEVKEDDVKFNQAFVSFYKELSPNNGKPVAQKHGNRFVIQLPPPLPLTQKELDKIYDLPYMRNPHPIYNKHNGIKGFEVVQTSIVSHRGCPGECNFCELGIHQGRIIQSRSEKSILNEAEKITNQGYFHGTISDVGGPTANLYKASCKLWKKGITCNNKNCLVPIRCKNLILGYNESIDLYSKISKLKNINHVFISSGFRYDLLAEPFAEKYFESLCRNHISGQMKVAPEHVSSKVLKLMNKPDFSVYERFVKKFYALNRKLKKKQFLVNYFILAHPGSTNTDESLMKSYWRSTRIRPEQVQDFTPLPMTASSCMHYTHKNPFTGKNI